MKIIIQLFRKHPVAIIVFLLYTLLCLGFVNMVFEFHERMKMNPGRSGISLGGEGVGFGGIFLFIIGGVFFIVTCGFAIGSKTETKFYLWLCLVIVLETIIALNLNL